MTYWQIAAGSASREYSEYFLRFGMAFVGDSRYVATIQQVQLGDRIILKNGTTEIKAAGVVVERNGRFKGDVSKEDDCWLRDYDGWDLPGYCCVEWHREPRPRVVTGLTRTTIQKVHEPQLQVVADEIIRTAPLVGLEPEPIATELLTDDEMLAFLIRKGLRATDAEELTGTLRRIRLLAEYYYNDCNWDDILEHEARTFLIIPFLIGLGWSEQQIKIELGVPGGTVDVACFRRLYCRDPLTNQANNQDCVLLLEGKAFTQGLDYAHHQGKGYAAHFPGCEVVVASNGYCYKAFKRKADGSGFDVAPSAYLNLLRPRKSYPLDPGKNNGGLELLSFLMPQRG